MKELDCQLLAACAVQIMSGLEVNSPKILVYSGA